MIQEKDVQVPVRDGVKIGVRIYRPEGSGPFPALFAASPYRYDTNELPPRPMFLWRETGPIEWYVDQGYAYVHADVRGTGLELKPDSTRFDVNGVRFTLPVPGAHNVENALGAIAVCAVLVFLLPREARPEEF